MSPAAKGSSSRKRSTKGTGATRAGTTRATKNAAARKPASKKHAAKNPAGRKPAPKKHAAKQPAATNVSTRKTPAKNSTKRSAAKPGSANSRALAEYNRKRDFTRTREPEGSVPAQQGKALQFVIQKHEASHLHYDFRLELDGVMKSWAVPKGPSLDPAVRRLAMEVEDHPISYNSFEGTIPEGQYGGGTVMLWDRGTYDAEDGGGAESLRRGYAKGDLKVTLAGKRLRGAWVLVRMNRPGRPQWLLIKHRDATAGSARDVTAEYTTSVVSRRTMQSIAADREGSKV